MALYYESETILRSRFNSGGLKSTIFAGNYTRTSPAQVYALITETIKWSPILKEVVENAGLLSEERKLSPQIALLLVHDHLLSKKGIAAPTRHPLRLSIEKHKSRLHSELVKSRIRRKCPDLKSLEKSLVIRSGPGSFTGRGPGLANESQIYPHPRWIRINTLRTSLSDQLKTTFHQYNQVSQLEDLRSETDSSTIFIDPHVQGLIAVHSSVDLTKSPAYLEGSLIFQEKASCFPALLLNPSNTDKVFLDACAAPGNKTTQIAALCESVLEPGFKILACERDAKRAETLRKMLAVAHADPMVEVYAAQDFLKTRLAEPPWQEVQAIILDPSCSGTGIIGREDSLDIALPARPSRSSSTSHGQKRKRGSVTVRNTSQTPQVVEQEPDSDIPQVTAERLAGLSGFQLKLLLHAFNFPNARKIVYSTCSTCAEENEIVVCRAITSPVASERGWRLLRREEQVEQLKKWERRGLIASCVETISDEVLAQEVARACIRCEKGGKGGTIGFFVAGFVRDLGHPLKDGASESEWEGFESDLQ
ncbi:MAG: hypothetical protein M1814_000418 [Vezdaea aestivalis]|nr:MAG: hypothetical protein M1814_000418 [Vezdaea aestivalis]